MMISIFQKFELKWWQAAIYEISMISLGIVIGARFLGYFRDVVGIFLIIFIIGAAYIAYIWFQQVLKKQKEQEEK